MPEKRLPFSPEPSDPATKPRGPKDEDAIQTDEDFNKMAKTFAQQKILALEALWDDRLERRITVTALLDLVTKITDSNYVVLSCNTREEFEFNINQLSSLTIKKQTGILLLVFHGEPGFIFLSDEVPLSLEELADILGDWFRGWKIHFSSCSTLAVGEARLKRFIRKTKASLISGYTKDMYWSECMAMDLLLLENIADCKRLWNAKKLVKNRYREFVKLTGLRLYSGR